MLKLLTGLIALMLSLITQAATIDGTWTDSSGQRVVEHNAGNKTELRDGDVSLGYTGFSIDDVRVVDFETKSFITDYNETRSGSKASCPFAINRIPVAKCTSDCAARSLWINREYGTSDRDAGYEFWTDSGTSSHELFFSKFVTFRWKDGQNVWTNLRAGKLSTITNFTQDYQNLSFVKNMKLYVEDYQIVIEIGGVKRKFDSIHDVRGTVVKIKSGKKPITVYNKVSLGYPVPSPSEFETPKPQPYNYSDRRSGAAYKLFDDNQLGVFKYYKQGSKYSWKAPVSYQKGKLNFDYIGVKDAFFKKNPSTGKYTGEVDLKLEVGRFIPNGSGGSTAPFVGLIELYKTPVYSKVNFKGDRVYYGVPSPIKLPLNGLKPSNLVKSSCGF